LIVTLKRLLWLLLVVAAGTAAYTSWVWRRAWPVVDGRRLAPGLARPVEIVRDHWGVPHIFAEEDVDAYYGLGWATAQDRLFQMELTRRVAQGRLAELLGPSFVATDKLFRTMALHSTGQRMLAEARPEARAAATAYAQGVNAYVASLGGSLPPEFALLRTSFAPMKDDDFVGVLGFMCWGLNQAWTFDPLYEKLVAKVGPDRAAELFPYNRGGSPSVYPAAAAPKLSLFQLSPSEEEVLGFLPTLSASNNWVVGPAKSASGKPILANDPHLGHGIPGIWYEAHLQTKALDVIGVTVPGFPAVSIGHNRHIAWGFTNVMLDAADFFVETLKPETGEVMSRGQWVKVENHEETIPVRGAAPVKLAVRLTPHGPIVSELMGQGETRALAYEWTFHADRVANEIDAFWDLDRARNWQEFRAAVRRFGALSQNIAYADVEGHIGLQATGAIPRLKGAPEGTLFREGASGEQDWDGFVPFEDMPRSFDPERGWLASANNPTLPAPMPYYISSQWEPVDRYERIVELLQAKDKLSVEDVQRMQMDSTLYSARVMTPMILAAFEAAPPSDPALQAALADLRGWSLDMAPESQAASVFAVFYRRLFHEVFDDELGSELAQGYRSRGNLSAIMLQQVMTVGPDRWFDRVDTPAVETKADTIRAAFTRAVHELQALLGPDPRDWAWGRLHTIELQHPLGRASRLLAFFFNRGPYPIAGHTQTVNKGEFAEEDFRVKSGPSMRQITDFADLARGRAVIPAGESGLPGSRHYDDLLPLWRKGEYHPFLMDRSDILKEAEGRLELRPQ
jgi:penicillin G amidase